ncbi:3-oxoacid CoA-transferase subunit B [Salipaludibacillus sp. LMS25]|jgi:acetate CoA/acetoacetate CoA-transferase beta subunit|uniref:3-oxoacid CoA-transferase subunit B n=1 Tax=Salipaludibacillus sp. LMS25 TaxID=2924031 RepID=UPI0020D06FE1|nr:3-oxoacid CoA-transferase subunit B [Salipaludibacillus sp. LMS25]UTR13568.1 3-oxoacid CoA-transferase subunit B [Salipaludibacillus sp. LMS25]
MTKEKKQLLIAKRVAKELTDGSLVNLGIGLPTKVAAFIPENKQVMLQSENGFVGLGPPPMDIEYEPDVVNAGGQPASILKGGSCFNSATSFGIIRGGHVDVTVLGALQVDEKGNMASYMIPGKMVPGMGGAMDLLTGSKKVIVATEHTVKGQPKIVEQCTLPLTASSEVNMIITEMAVIHVTSQGLVVTEINEMYHFNEVQKATGAKLHEGDGMKAIMFEE